MRLCILIAGLLLPSLAAAQSGDPIADYGHAVPGHAYDYVVYYRNTDSIAVTVAKDPSGCSSCPNLRMRYDPVAPGDSLALHFRLTLEPGDTGATEIQLPVIVVHGPHKELISYTLMINGGESRTIAASEPAIGVREAGQGLLAGTLHVRNISDHTIMILPAGLPPGLSFDPAAVKVKPGRNGSMTFHCAADALLQHRSLTFRVIEAGREVERFSLPLVEQ